MSVRELVAAERRKRRDFHLLWWRRRAPSGFAHAHSVSTSKAPIIRSTKGKYLPSQERLEPRA